MNSTQGAFWKLKKGRTLPLIKSRRMKRREKRGRKAKEYKQATNFRQSECCSRLEGSTLQKCFVCGELEYETLGDTKVFRLNPAGTEPSR